MHMGLMSHRHYNSFLRVSFAATHILFFYLFKWASMAKGEPSEQFHLHANIAPDKCIVPGSKGAEVTETLPRHSEARELRSPRHLLDTQGKDYNEAILFAE